MADPNPQNMMDPLEIQHQQLQTMQAMLEAARHLPIMSSKLDDVTRKLEEVRAENQAIKAENQALNAKLDAARLEKVEIKNELVLSRRLSEQPPKTIRWVTSVRPEQFTITFGGKNAEKTQAATAAAADKASEKADKNLADWIQEQRQADIAIRIDSVTRAASSNEGVQTMTLTVIYREVRP